MTNDYKVTIEVPAWNDLMKLPRKTQEQILEVLEALELDPRPFGVVKLSGPDDLYRVRSGDYRVVYRIEDDVLQVLVVKIGHRREVYR